MGTETGNTYLSQRHNKTKYSIQKTYNIYILILSPRSDNNMCQQQLQAACLEEEHFLHQIYKIELLLLASTYHHKMVAVSMLYVPTCLQDVTYGSCIADNLERNFNSIFPNEKWNIPRLRIEAVVPIGLHTSVSS